VSTTPDRVGIFDSTTGIWSVDNQGTGDVTPPGGVDRGQEVSHFRGQD
jgi:hypothetical protein